MVYILYHALPWAKIASGAILFMTKFGWTSLSGLCLARIMYVAYDYQFTREKYYTQRDCDAWG